MLKTRPVGLRSHFRSYFTSPKIFADVAVLVVKLRFADVAVLVVKLRFADVAQLVEHRFRKAGVDSSILSIGSWKKI